jgi:hypothetical protein
MNSNTFENIVFYDFGIEKSCSIARIGIKAAVPNLGYVKIRGVSLKLKVVNEYMSKMTSKGPFK